jgi:hypothetical protein
MAPGVVALEKVERRRIGLVLETDGRKQYAERIAHGLVVIDEINDRSVVFHASAASSPSGGNSTVKIVPPAGFSEYLSEPS